MNKLTLTLMLSLAEVSKNSILNESASCLPRSNEITRSSSYNFKAMDKKNQTAAIRQVKFYLLRQASAAAVGETPQ